MRLTSQLPVEYEYPADQVSRSLRYVFETLTKNYVKPTYSFLLRSRANILSWYRDQYLVITAVKDFRKAVHRNEDIYFAALVVSTLLGYAYAVAASEIFITFFLTGYTLAVVSEINVLFVSAGVSLMLAITVTWLAAFVTNILSISIYQGAYLYKVKSVSKTFRQGLQHTSRTTFAWILMLAYIALPMVAIGVLSLLYVILTKPGQYELINVAMIDVFVGIIALGYILVNYSLFPLISIFESHRNFLDAFILSRDRIARRGRLFVLTMYIFLLGGIAGSYGLATLLHNQFGSSKAFIITLGSIASVMAFQSVMVAFYVFQKASLNKNSLTVCRTILGHKKSFGCSCF